MVISNRNLSRSTELWNHALYLEDEMQKTWDKTVGSRAINTEWSQKYLSNSQSVWDSFFLKFCVKHHLHIQETQQASSRVKWKKTTESRVKAKLLEHKGEGETLKAAEETRSYTWENKGPWGGWLFIRNMEAGTRQNNFCEVLEGKNC